MTSVDRFIENTLFSHLINDANFSRRFDIKIHNDANKAVSLYIVCRKTNRNFVIIGLGNKIVRSLAIIELNELQLPTSMLREYGKLDNNVLQSIKHCLIQHY